MNAGEQLWPPVVAAGHSSRCSAALAHSSFTLEFRYQKGLWTVFLSEVAYHASKSWLCSFSLVSLLLVLYRTERFGGEVFQSKDTLLFFHFVFFTSLCMWEHRQWCWWWKPAGGNVLEVFSQLKYWKTHYLGKINLAFLLFFCEYLHGWRKGCLKTAWFLLTIRQWRGVTASIPLNKLILFLARSFLPVH